MSGEDSDLFPIALSLFEVTRIFSVCTLTSAGMWMLTSPVIQAAQLLSRMAFGIFCCMYCAVCGGVACVWKH